MKLFSLIVERVLIFTFVLCFTFALVYVPQPPKAEAACATCSTWVMQAVQVVEEAATTIYSGMSSFSSSVTSAMQSNQWLKDNGLDGVAWALAKSIMSRMTTSVVNWINSGFQGSPSFISDFEGFLRDAADSVAGEFIASLDDNLSFLCSPFKLDVRVALSISYNQARGGQPAPSCSLSSMINNVTNFVNQSAQFVQPGGWDTWFSITANPGQYTSLGSFMTAESSMRARLVNAEGKELKLLDFGNGFLSNKQCEQVNSGPSQTTRCKITTPGNVISEGLNKQLGAGQDALIEADEINEIITALFGQLAQQAITGANGLLGLSGGTGYTPANAPPYVNMMDDADPGSNPQKLMNELTEAVQSEDEYLGVLTIGAPNSNTYYQKLLAYSLDLTMAQAKRTMASEAATEIANATTQRNQAAANRVVLNDLITELTTASSSPTMTRAEKSDVIRAISDRYLEMRRTVLHTKQFVDGERLRFETILKPAPIQ